MLVLYTPCLYAQRVSNIYRFYNTLSTTEPTCAEDLTPVMGLNGKCVPSVATPTGGFIADTIFNIYRKVYHNNINWGLKYLNTKGVIAKTYTVQMYIKVTNFNMFYTRIIDFSNGTADNGIYFTNYNTPPPNDNRCLNFYPYGNYGPCPFFNNHTYYLLTITRNDQTKKIEIYVNDDLFTTYLDVDDFYTSVAGRPVLLFRDDPVGFACEDGEANFAYLSFANYYSSQSDVSSVYQNINAIANGADFSVSSTAVCPGSEVTVNYTGNISAASGQFTFNWAWDGGTIIAGSGAGPYTINWATEGVKTINLSIVGGCANNAIASSKQIAVNGALTTTTDTVICPGQSYFGYTASGTYSKTFTTASGCDSTSTVNLTVLPFLAPDLGKANTVCMGDSLILNPGTFDSYLWQDGSVKNTYVVKTAGLYYVTVAAKCGTANARLQVDESNCDVYFPTVFTPNGDNKNDVFRILTAAAVQKYKLSIFNRYGQMIFETTDVAKGWDGTLHGQRQNQGTYVWYCTYTRSNITHQVKGNIVLVR